jgi:hypothetical protein
MGDCWVWTAYKNRKGYGVMSVDNRLRPATHIAWFLHTGDWPSKLMLHSCDNPSCVNPAHLREGSAAENSADMVARGRTNAPSGERSGHAKLTWEAVDDIRTTPRTYGYRKRLAEKYGVSPSTISGVLIRGWAK